MKRPSFQFYPSDYQGNSNLKRCTHEEKGIWVDVLCLLHDQEPYGLLRWTLAEIAQAVNTTPEKLTGLVRREILKGHDEKCQAFIYRPRSGRREGEPITLIAEQAGPLWYSSRMVRDEYLRKIRGASTQFTSESQPQPSPHLSPKGGLGERSSDGSTSSSSSSSTSITDLDKSKSSGAPSAPPGPVDFKKAVFREGLKLIGGDNDKNRQFLGQLVRDYGTKLVVEAMLESEKQGPVDAKGYIKKLLGERGQKIERPQKATTSTPARPEQLRKGTGGFDVT